MKIIDLLTQNERTQINKLISEYEKGDEFEVSMFSTKETGSEMMTMETFNRLNSVLSIITQKNEDKYKKESEDILDIIFVVKNLENTEKLETFRISIKTVKMINFYMDMLHDQKNSLIFKVLLGYIIDKSNADSSDRTNLSLIKKIKNFSKYITLEDFYMKVKLDNETNVSKEEIKKLLEIEKNYDINSYDVLYRFKQRDTYYILKDKNKFKIDLTKTRTSSHINQLNNAYMKNEMEIECDIQNKSKFVEELFEVSEYLIKIVQQTNFIVTKSLNNKIISKYKDILGSTKETSLYGRKPVSVEIQHVTDVLPNRYAVTDKADGDRNQLIIVDGRCYLISMNLLVRDTGIEVSKKINDSILDGELIYLQKYHKYLYMSFDCLTYGTTNAREEANMLVRLSLVDKVIDELNKTEYKHTTTKLNYNNKEELLKYHYEKIVEFYTDIDKEIKKKESKIIFRRKYFIECNGISDSEIFAYSTLLWKSITKDANVKCPYLLDGLIYQPLDQKYVIEKDKSKYLDYKWKPPEMNSIDFYVEFEKDKSGKVLVIYDNSVLGTIKNKPYKILNLYVGLAIKGVQKPVLFDNENSHSQAYLYLDDSGEVRSKDGKLIQDKTVVEFSYDLTADINNNYRWIPLRTRYDKTENVHKNHTDYGNYVDVAFKIWRSINNPVSEQDLQILSDEKTYDTHIKQMRGRIDYTSIRDEKRLDIYYQKKSRLAEEMRHFNNYVKSNLIYTYYNWRYNDRIKNKILDAACGRGGDVQKFYYVEAEIVVGFDRDIQGITDAADGAITRYQNERAKHAKYPPMFFMQASAINLLKYEDQIKELGRMNNEMEKTFKRFFTFDDKRMIFDRLNCMFALHYFLENERTWSNFCENVNMYLRDGGYFVFTTFDANFVKSKFKEGNDKYSVYYDEAGEKKLSYELKKRWNDSDKNPYGQALDVYMSWAFEEGVFQTEYLVYPDFVINSLEEKCNMVLVETDTFENFYNNNMEFLKIASEVEEGQNKKFYTNAYGFYKDTEAMKGYRDYSFLNRYYVFRKKEKDLVEIKKMLDKKEKLIKSEIESTYLKKGQKNKRR